MALLNLARHTLHTHARTGTHTHTRMHTHSSPRSPASPQNVSRYPSSALGNGGATHRSVLGSGIAAASGGGQSFWAGMSFNTAQRQSNALLAHFDVVLWMGDLNYRIAGNPQVRVVVLGVSCMHVVCAATATCGGVQRLIHA